jgi:hypothetical protein
MVPFQELRQYSSPEATQEWRSGSDEASLNTAASLHDALKFKEQKRGHNGRKLPEDGLENVDSRYTMVDSTSTLQEMHRGSQYAADGRSVKLRRNISGEEDRLSKSSSVNDPNRAQYSPSRSNNGLSGAFLARLKATSETRNNIVGWRDNIAAARRQHRQHRHQVSKCIKEFEDLAFQVVSMMHFPDGATRDAHEKMQSVLQNLKREGNKLSKIEKELRDREDGLDSAELKLSSHERQLSKKEQALLREQLEVSGAAWDAPPLRSPLAHPAETGLKALIISTVAQSDHTEDDDDNSYEADSEHAERASLYAFSGTSSSINPQEHQYYDEIGNVTLAREHLYNLETDYLQNLYARDAQRKAGKPSTVPDSHFFQEYFSERKRLIQQYISSKNLVYRWYRACQDAGIEVEEPNLPPIAGSTLDHSNRAEADSLHSGFVDVMLHRTIVFWNARVLATLSKEDRSSIWQKETPWSDDVLWPAVEITDEEALARTVPRSQSYGNFSSNDSEQQPKENGGFVSEVTSRRYSDPNPLFQVSAEQFEDTIKANASNASN